MGDVCLGAVLGLAGSYIIFRLEGRRQKGNQREMFVSNLNHADGRVSGDNIGESALIEAIKLYEDLIKTCSPKDFPKEYTWAQNNLGTAYRNLAEVRNKEENLKKAITAYQEALKIYTAEDFPIIHERMSSNLKRAKSLLKTPPKPTKIIH